MGHIREVRWVVYRNEKGEKIKLKLQQRDGKYGCWDDVPVIEKKCNSVEEMFALAPEQFDLRGDKK